MVKSVSLVELVELSANVVALVELRSVGQESRRVKEGW